MKDRDYNDIPNFKDLNTDLWLLWAFFRFHRSCSIFRFRVNGNFVTFLNIFCISGEHTKQHPYQRWNILAGKILFFFTNIFLVCLYWTIMNILGQKHFIGHRSNVKRRSSTNVIINLSNLLSSFFSVKGHVRISALLYLNRTAAKAV